MSLPPITFIVCCRSGSKPEKHDISAVHPTPLVNIMLNIPNLFRENIFQPTDIVEPIMKTVAERFNEELNICDFRTVIELTRKYPDFLKSCYASVPIIERLLRQYLSFFAYCYIGPACIEKEFNIQELPDEYESIKCLITNAHREFLKCEEEQSKETQKLVIVCQQYARLVERTKEKHVEEGPWSNTQHRLRQDRIRTYHLAETQRLVYEFGIKKNFIIASFKDTINPSSKRRVEINRIKPH